MFKCIVLHTFCSTVYLKAEETWPLGVTQRSQNMELLASKSNNENPSKKITQSHFLWTSTVIIAASSWKKMMVPAGQDHAGGVEHSSTSSTPPTFNKS